MSMRDFELFVAQQNSNEASRLEDEKIDTENWLENIQILYQQIATFLLPFIEDKSIILTTEAINIEESNITPYCAKCLNIKIGASKVALVPIGRMIFAAYGRVDLKGPTETKKLLLVPKEPEKVGVRFMSKQDALDEENQTDEPVELVWRFSGGAGFEDIDLNELTLKAAVMDVVG